MSDRVVDISNDDADVNVDQELADTAIKLKQIDAEISRLKSKKLLLEERRQKLLELKEKNEFQKVSGRNWESTDFPWSERVGRHLRETFRLATFRPLQMSAINAFMSGLNVLVVMPTGGGKSLCYQLPALASEKGFTLVVSPLISLMEDQVMALTRANVPAAMLNASSTKEQVNKIQADMLDPKSTMRLLYVTPEKLANSKRFMAKLQKSYEAGLFNKLAIDEVHCCSQWGHDFRTDYKVAEDVKKILRIGQQCIVFRSPLNRRNLYYEVRPKPDTHEACIEALTELLSSDFAEQSGIIYTLTIKDAESLAADLQKEPIL